MFRKPHESRDRILDAAENTPASTWLEAVEALLEHQAAEYREKLYGESIDRQEARKHIVAINKIRDALRNEPGMERKISALPSNDPLVRRMRRADLLCPKGWRDGIRKKLVAVADGFERKYIEGPGSLLDDQDIVDAQEFRKFIAELDFVSNRGDSARQEYARKAMKVANG